MIPDRVYFRIGDVAEIVGVKAYVLRYWETEFSIVAPTKSATGQRVYKRTDVEALLLIKKLLYTDRFSIEGARKRLRELRKEGALRKTIEAAADGVKLPEPTENGELPEAVSLAAEKLSVARDLAQEKRIARLRVMAGELQALIEAPLTDIFKV